MMIAAPVCAAAQLRVAQGPGVSEATGQHTLAIRVVNASKSPCVLRGYPYVVARAGRRPLPFRISHAGDQMVTDEPPVTVPLPPRRAAWVLVNQYRCDAGVVASATSIEIGGLRLGLVRGAVSWCGRGDPGSTLTVSPYEPTEARARRTPTCGAWQLRLRPTFQGAAGGQFVQTLTFTNTGWACELRGWPTVRGARTRRVLQDGPPRVVALPAHGAASFDLFGEDYDHLRQRTCPTVRSLVVDGIPVRVRMPHCGTWNLAPYVAGRVDRAAWTTVAHG